MARLKIGARIGGSQMGLVDDYLGRDKRDVESSAPCNITNL